MSDWADHLTTIFPEVRLKSFLEMRGADGGKWRRICGMPALWVGILYDSVALDAAWDLVKDWTAEERQAHARRGAASWASRRRSATPRCRSWRTGCWRFPPPGCAAAPRMDARRHERGRFPQSPARTGGARLYPRRGIARAAITANGTAISRACSRNIIFFEFYRTKRHLDYLDFGLRICGVLDMRSANWPSTSRMARSAASCSARAPPSQYMPASLLAEPWPVARVPTSVPSGPSTVTPASISTSARAVLLKNPDRNISLVRSSSPLTRMMPLNLQLRASSAAGIGRANGSTSSIIF